VVASPSEVRPGERVTVSGRVTRAGQPVAGARVQVNVDGYPQFLVVTVGTGEYRAEFMIRSDDRARTANVVVRHDGASASTSFRIVEPTPLQRGAGQVAAAVTGAVDRIAASVTSASVQVRPYIRLVPAAETVFNQVGARTDVIRGFGAELLYRTAQGRELRKTDVNLEVTISGPRSATISLRSGSYYDMRDFPPGNYTISARWPGGTSVFQTEAIPGVLVPLPLNSAPATATIQVTLGGARATTTTTPTGVQPSQNLEQEARNRLSQIESRLNGLRQRYDRARSTARTFIVVEAANTVYSRTSGQPVPPDPIQPVEDPPGSGRFVRRPVVPDLMVSVIDMSLYRDYSSAVTSADRLFNAIRSLLSQTRREISAGAYASAIQTLAEAESQLNELEREIAKMERFIDAVLRTRSTPTNVRPVTTEPHTQNVTTRPDRPVPTETRTGQTYTTGQTSGPIEATTSNKEAVRNRLASLRSELNSILSEIPSREGVLASLNREQGSLTNEIQSLRQRVQELQSRLSNIGSYVSNEAALRNRLAELRAEVEGLRSQLANLQTIRDDLALRIQMIPVR